MSQHYKIDDYKLKSLKVSFSIKLENYIDTFSKC